MRVIRRGCHVAQSSPCICVHAAVFILFFPRNVWYCSSNNSFIECSDHFCHLSILSHELPSRGGEIREAEEVLTGKSKSVSGASTLSTRLYRSGLIMMSCFKLVHVISGLVQTWCFWNCSVWIKTLANMFLYGKTEVSCITAHPCAHVHAHAHAHLHTR